jgi:hypothetical protein
MIAAFPRTEEGAEFDKPKTTSSDPESLNFLRPVYLWWQSKGSSTEI